MRIALYITVALCSVFSASAVCAQSTHFGIDSSSPEVPGRSPADILDSPGTGVVVSAATLGLPATVEVDALSYGEDRIEPAGPRFSVAILYSVDRETVGLQGGGTVGAGAVRLQSTGNGAAGDSFLLRAVWAPQPTGVVPIARGLHVDAPLRNLTPKGAGVQSNLDGMSFRMGDPVRTVYFSVDRSGVPGQSWGPADILRVDIDPATGAATPARVWATATQLGLQPGDDIDALAVLNVGGDTLGQPDVVYVSVDGSTRRNLPQGSEAVLQVFPGLPQVIFDASDLNLEPGTKEDLDALTGIDPGDDVKQEQQKQKGVRF